MQILFALYSNILNNVIIQVLVLVWPGLGPRVCSFPRHLSHFGLRISSPLIQEQHQLMESLRSQRRQDMIRMKSTYHVNHFLSLPHFLGISMDFTRSFANWSQLTREQVLKVGAPGQMHQPASLLLLWYLCSKWTLFFQRRAGATLFVTAKENDRSASACSPPEAADQWRETSSKRL